MIREHFGDKLRNENPEGWKEAHKRLYHYYKDLPDKELPDTLEEMEPLFAAVAHGCRAGLHQETLDDVYWKRICRSEKAFINNELGAFGADLAALSNFFDKPWSHPAAGLTEEVKAVVLSWAAFGLGAQGRLHEAIQPFKAGLEMRIKQEVWKSAAINAGNISELMLTLGRVEEAVAYARESVTHADQSEDDFQMESKRTTLADALHQAGQLEEAEQWFCQAEEMQNERQRSYPFLYSLQGYQFCDLLLSQGKYKDVMERAEKTLEWAILVKASLLALALDHLSLGRAWMMKAFVDGRRDFTKAMDYLNRAAAGLREAGTNDHLPRGLLARAECYRYIKEFSKARADLNEAEEIAELGGMKLHLCDFHLEAGRLCLAEENEEQAEKHFSMAKKMIEETGYHRRDKEVERLRG
ncbi:MAG: hypothetical protein GTO24_18085 [candidate division Zixibacteria bacterium]|nr:hypothetical protein [candidate division Zixibacteria bacterium]